MGAADTGPDGAHWFSRVGPDVRRCLWPIRRTTFAVETGIAEPHTAPPISAERPGVKVRASKAHELSLLPSRDGPLRTRTKVGPGRGPGP
jgi:hypothetical protein